MTNKLTFAFNLINSHLISYLVPSNLNSNWNLGFILGFVFMFQMVSGILLTFYYIPGENNSFDAVTSVLIDVNMGWAVRYFHAQGVSFCFFFLYLHMLKGLLYSSSYLPWSWYSGMILYVLSMAVAFLGYVLPYGQMSYWGAVVMTNLFYWCPDFVLILLGGYGMTGATLQSFYMLHFMLPFVLLIMMMLHMYYLHSSSSTNPLSGADSVLTSSFYPVVMFSDLKMLTLLFVLIGVQLTYGKIPLFQGDCDNSIIANPLQTPAHMVPEWYLLVFYATLKLLPSKLAGLAAMVALLEAFTLVAESSSKSTIMTCSHYHSMWSHVSVPIIPSLFLLGCLGSLALNNGLFFMGVCSLLMMVMAIVKLCDRAKTRL